MKLGLLITSISNFGIKGFYNSQEIGLAKALSPYVTKIHVYKLIDFKLTGETEALTEYNNIVVHTLPARHLGINGLPHVNQLEKGLDCLIHFSDTQMSVPYIYKWATRNSIAYIPYVGVLESHSSSKIKKTISNILLKRNLAIYKKNHCFVKTPSVEKKLKEHGITQTTTMPVGLDLSLVNNNYPKADKKHILSKYGFESTDKILLFIGRMIDEKEPILMLEIFKKLYEKDNHYRLIMIGTGPLKEKAMRYVNTWNLNQKVKIISKVPNSEVWELYVIAQSFINLNKQEIFGMAILEALYYGCKVVAWKAPGPTFIIDSNTGIIADSVDSIIDGIEKGSIDAKKAHQHILSHFTWDITAKNLINFLENQGR